MGIENRLFCRLDGLTASARERQRFNAIKQLGLLQSEAIPVFEEATQTAARFLEIPICLWSAIAQDRQIVKAAVGLSHLGLMNPLATNRVLPRRDSFCTYVVDSQNALAIEDTKSQFVFANSLLVSEYGVRAYLGVPLFRSTGQCLGTLAVMDLEPRHFSERDREFLTILARWSISEYERNQLIHQEQEALIYRVSKSRSKNRTSSLLAGSDLMPGNVFAAAESQTTSTRQAPQSSVDSSSWLHASSMHATKVKLLNQLTQELRTPLTSVMGMASVLGREVYGPLTNKQKEYLDIIHNSGQHLVALVEEILGLGILEEQSPKLRLGAVDVDMLAQQAINNLFYVAKQRQQTIRLSIEPGKRIWLLDKVVVRQLLFYLMFSVIESATPGGVVRLHISRLPYKLNISIWITHPWLEEGISVNSYLSSPMPESVGESASLEESSSELKLSEATFAPTTEIVEQSTNGELGASSSHLSSYSIAEALTDTEGLTQATMGNGDRTSLGLFLSCQLATLHGGQIDLQGSLDTGYRYVVTLPLLSEEASS